MHCSPALAATGVCFGSSLWCGNQSTEQKFRMCSAPRNTANIPTARTEGWEDGNRLWGWCLCSPGSALPAQTQLLALLRNPVDALFFLLLLALRCTAGPSRTHPPRQRGQRRPGTAEVEPNAKRSAEAERAWRPRGRTAPAGRATSYHFSYATPAPRQTRTSVALFSHTIGVFHTRE